MPIKNCQRSSWYLVPKVVTLISLLGSGQPTLLTAQTPPGASSTPYPSPQTQATPPALQATPTPQATPPVSIPTNPDAFPRPAATPASAKPALPNTAPAVGSPTPAPAPAPATAVPQPSPAANVGSAATPLQSSPPLSQSTLDAVLVTVGDEIILLSELQKVIQVASDRQTTLTPTGQLVGGALGPTDAQQLLEQLIDQKVLNLKVKEMTLNVGDEELDSEITAFLKQQNLSREQFEQVLRQEGETPETHREEFRQQLETQRFIGRVIRPLVTVTDDEVKAFYLQNASGGQQGSRVRLRSLVVNLPPELTESQKQAKEKTLATVKQQLESGTPFASLVKLYSESPDAEKTEGLLPARPLQELPQEVRDGLKSAKVNDVIGPVRIGSSAFFFQYVGAESDSVADFDKQKQQWENKLLETKFKERLSEYVRAERSKVKIARRPFTFSR